MNTAENGIDWSVNSMTENTLMKNWKNYIPMFPVSTAEKLKYALVKKLGAEYAIVGSRLVMQAVNEAYATAAQTVEPLLFLPALAEEKVQKAACWSARQQSILQTGRLPLAC